MSAASNIRTRSSQSRHALDRATLRDSEIDLSTSYGRRLARKRDYVARKRNEVRGTIAQAKSDGVMFAHDGGETGVWSSHERYAQSRFDSSSVRVCRAAGWNPNKRRRKNK